MSVMWMFALLLGINLSIIYLAKFFEWYNGTQDSRSTKIGAFGAGNFLHNSPFEGNPLVESIANAIAPLWRKGVYEEIPVGFPGNDYVYDNK